MREAIKKRLDNLERSREPAEADGADYVVAAWSAEPEKEFAKLPPPKKGTLMHVMCTMYELRKKSQSDNGPAGDA